MRRQERTETSKLLFYTSRWTATPGNYGARHRCIVDSDASAAKGGGESTILRSVCQELPNEVKVTRSSWKTEGYSSRDEGGQNTYGIWKFPLESIVQGAVETSGERKGMSERL